MSDASERNPQQTPEDPPAGPSPPDAGGRDADGREADGREADGREADGREADGASGTAPPSGEPASPIATPEEIEQLRVKARERDACLNELLRAKADLDNYQKRVRRDRAAWEAQAVGRVIVRLLPVIDDFERAIEAAGAEGATVESLADGVRITRSAFLGVLDDLGVEEIPAVGERFDPEVHEAVMEEASERPTGEVTGIVQKGYRRDGAVLRPARVVVARNQGGA